MVEMRLVLAAVGGGALAVLAVIGIWLNERIFHGESESGTEVDSEPRESAASETREAEEAERVEAEETEPVETDESHA